MFLYSRKPSLKELLIGGEFGDKITDNGILNICEPDSGLQSLTIDNCAITDESLSIILRILKNLIFLDVRNCTGLTLDGIRRVKVPNGTKCEILCDFDVI